MEVLCQCGSAMKTASSVSPGGWTRDWLSTIRIVGLIAWRMKKRVKASPRVIRKHRTAGDTWEKPSSRGVGPVGLKIDKEQGAAAGWSGCRSLWPRVSL